MYKITTTKQFLLLLAIMGISAVAFPQQIDHQHIYTYNAIDKHIEGKVYVDFVLDEKGNIISDSVKVWKGLGYGLDEIAIYQIQHAPSWKPTGRQQKFTVPVVFSIGQIDKNEWSDFYAKKGDNYIMRNAWADAIECYKEAITRNNANADAYYGLSRAYESKGDKQNAKSYLEKAYKKGFKKRN
jgi:tetratricopeptide (TPR) repeat protein